MHLSALFGSMWPLLGVLIQAPTDDPGEREDFYADMPASGGDSSNGIILVLAVLGFVGWLIYNNMQQAEAAKLRLEDDLRAAERQRQEMEAEVAELNERLRKRAEFEDLAERYKARPRKDAQAKEDHADD